MELVIRPAVAGVENVLAAASRAGGVRRVVMTSSVAAVVGDHWERGRDHVFTEADWNLTATETRLPYHRLRPLLHAAEEGAELVAFLSAGGLFFLKPEMHIHNAVGVCMPLSGIECR